MPMTRHTSATISATSTAESPASDTIIDDKVTPIPVRLIIATRICAPASSTPMMTRPLPASVKPASTRRAISRGGRRIACVATKATSSPAMP